MVLRLLLCTLLIIAVTAKICRPKASGTKLATFVNNDVNSIMGDPERSTVRHANQLIYFWPSLSEFEQDVLRDSFKQISRRSCIKFEEQPWQPWYHADRWEPDRPYVIIRKSRQYAAYTDNKLEGGVQRTILYISQNAFEQNSYNQSRGAVMDQLVRYMGMRKELLRPDASSYVKDNVDRAAPATPRFHPAQLSWPFDPESITVPLSARKSYSLTEYCPARNDADIGAGQRVGLLTRWDAIKLNSMYCPQEVEADPRRGPCVVPRKKDLNNFKKKLNAYKELRKH
ncbi:hypothetical protein PRIPAC_89355 [Pristionchus pacificus]|uniref:Uncharacterized protein n=1 Tax=Pristionchus pacificus TaxID=54126 RepID=A0A2A6B5U5_PRIPA|nr:hypothetical protein PRIPAC_89355 [Pristionchus pacificus]|eukprot:PDM61247.1 hypothetical protein PRIPAC_50689 [Pristionchus pacificus]